MKAIRTAVLYALMTIMATVLLWQSDQLGLLVPTYRLVLTGLLAAAALILIDSYWWRTLKKLSHSFEWENRPITIVPNMLDQWGLLITLVCGIAVSISEEILYRGILQPMLGMVATSILFIVIHQRDKRQSLRLIPMTLVYASFMEWGHSLVPGIIAHAVINVRACVRLWRAMRAN